MLLISSVFFIYLINISYCNSWCVVGRGACIQSLLFSVLLVLVFPFLSSREFSGPTSHKHGSLVVNITGCSVIYFFESTTQWSNYLPQRAKVLLLTL